jgi:hypothetical protein
VSAPFQFLEDIAVVDRDGDAASAATCVRLSVAYAMC